MCYLGQLKSPHSQSLNFWGIKSQQQFITPTSRKVLSEGWHIQPSVPVAFSPKCGLQGALQHQTLLQKGKTGKGNQAGTSNRYVDAPNTSAWRGFQQDVTFFLLCLNVLLTEILGMPFCIDTATSSLKFLSLTH